MVSFVHSGMNYGADHSRTPVGLKCGHGLFYTGIFETDADRRTFRRGCHFVLVQPEMEKRRSPLVSIPPFERGFSRHGVFRSDGGWAAQERALTPPFIVSMSPPGYPSAWLRPRSARFRFARQNHCNSATSCRFSTSGLPVTPPEPRPARPES